MGFYNLGQNTIFHCVASKEGVYILSFGPYWGSRLDKVSTKFIEKNYDIDHDKNYTPEKYAQKVSKIKYKNHPIFLVHFFRWEKAGDVFEVYFPRSEKNTCIPTENMMKKYKKLHSENN